VVKDVVEAYSFGYISRNASSNIGEPYTLAGFLKLHDVAVGQD
jgi:hypothetical protein